MVNFTEDKVPSDCFTVYGACGLPMFFLEGKWYDARYEPNVRKIETPEWWRLKK